MKEKIWVMTLIVFFILGFVFQWTLWIRIVVILNALLVLSGVISRLIQHRNGMKNDG